MFKRKPIKNTPLVEMSLVDLLKQFIISKLPKPKKEVSHKHANHQPRIPEDEITHIAIILDGVVEDVMRTQNRLAALLLSDPEFVEFDILEHKPQIGLTKYKDGTFFEEGLKRKDEE